MRQALAAMVVLALVAIGLWLIRGHGRGASSNDDAPVPVFVHSPLPVEGANGAAGSLGGRGAEAGGEQKQLWLTGRVMNGPKGAAGATVHFGDRQLAADDQGHFRVELTEPWKHLWATSGDRVTQVVDVSAVMTVPGEVVLALGGVGATLRVNVLDATTEAPIAQAVLRDKTIGSTAETDARGRATLGGLPPGALTAKVTAAGYIPASVWVSLVGGQVLETRVRLDREAVVTGRVVDSAGQPIKNATVTLKASGMAHATAATVMSGNDGRFEAHGVRVGRGYVVQAALPGYAGAAQAVVAPAHVELVMPAGASLHGVVHDGHGAALEGVSVRALPAPGQSASALRTTVTAITAADGSYDMKNLLAGKYLLSAQRPGEKSVLENVIDLVEGERRRDDITLQVGDGRLDGEVVDAISRTPLRRVTVTVNTADGAFELPVGADGRFHHTGLTSETVTVSATAEGYQPQNQTVATRDGRVSFVLQRGFWVGGRAVDEAGAPLARFSIDGVEFYELDGRFAVAPAQAARDLVVSSVGRVTARLSLEAARSGAGLNLGDVVLPLGEEVTVEVRDWQDRPVAGAHVWSAEGTDEPPRLQMRDGKGVVLSTTDEAGRARWPSSVAEPCLFATVLPNPPSSLAACPMRGPGPHVLRMPKPATVRGRITARGSPLSGVTVLEDQEGVSTITNADGSYTLEALSAGSRNVAVSTGLLGEGEARVIDHRVVVAEGEDVRHDVDLELPASLDVEIEAPDEGAVIVTVVEGPPPEGNEPAPSLSSRQLRVMAGKTVVHLGALQPGPASLACGYWSEQDTHVWQPLTIQPGANNRVVVRLHPR